MEVPLRGWIFSIYAIYCSNPCLVGPCGNYTLPWTVILLTGKTKSQGPHHSKSPIHGRATLDNAGTRPKPWQVYKSLEFSPTQSSPSMKIIATVNHCYLKDREDHGEQSKRCQEANREKREPRAGGCEGIREPPMRKARARAADAPRTRTKVTENKKYWNNSKKRRDNAEINVSHDNHREPWRSNRDQPWTTELQETIPSHHQNNKNNWETPPELHREQPNTEMLFACLSGADLRLGCYWCCWCC